jgi:2,4-dienoyl-CoA reductase-like NADH-dependent reductase (Old Yellow Enzyme family)
MTKAGNARRLDEPLRLRNGMVLKNRIAKAALSETLATYDNRPTLRHVEFYRRWAASGIGLLITGNVMVDRRALGEPGDVAIEDQRDLPHLRQWARAAHREWRQSATGRERPLGVRESGGNKEMQ